MTDKTGGNFESVKFATLFEARVGVRLLSVKCLGGLKDKGK